RSSDLAITPRPGVDQAAQHASGRVQHGQGEQGDGAEQGKQHAGRGSARPFGAGAGNRYGCAISKKRAFSPKMARVAELTDNLRGDAESAGTRPRQRTLTRRAQIVMSGSGPARNAPRQTCAPAPPVS